jgi:hypothetical protein
MTNKNSTREQVVFRTELWRKFVADHQPVLEASTNEEWSAFCSKFRERYVAGK